MKFQANIPIGDPGLVSKGFQETYRRVVAELGKGAEDPSRKLAASEGEPLDLVTGLTRLAKLYTLDYPAEFLHLGAKGLEDPSSLSASQMLELAGGAISGGLPGGGAGPASMAGRVPLKGFFSPLQKAIRSLIKEGTPSARGAVSKGKVVKKPGQALLNLLKKKGVSSEELRSTKVEQMLAQGQKPIPLKDVMKQAISEEISVGKKSLDTSPAKKEYLQYLKNALKYKQGKTKAERHKEIELRQEYSKLVRTFPKYSEPAYRKPFEVLEETPYEETLLILKGKGEGFKDPSHYQNVENLIAWSRSELRPGSKGEKVRLMQEVQESEWGIRGRKEGFEELTEKEVERLSTLGKKLAAQGELNTQEGQEWSKLRERVPQTPFKKDALKLMLKKELHKAASDPSVSHLGWTTGAMQAYERWPAPEAEKKLLQLYDEFVPNFMKKQTRRLGKGKEGVLEEVDVERISASKPKPVDEPLRGQFIERYGRPPKDVVHEPIRVKVPTIKMEDWLRKAILKGQRIAQVDQAPFKEFMYG